MAPPDFFLCSVLEEILEVEADERGICRLPGWDIDDFDDLTGLLLAAQWELGQSIQSTTSIQYLPEQAIAAVYTLQDAEKVLQRETDTLFVYLLTTDEQDIQPIWDLVAGWKTDQGDLELQEHIIEVGEDAAVRIAWKVDWHDRAWLQADISRDPEALEDYFTLTWIQQRHRLLLRTALRIMRRSVVEGKAIRRLEPGLLHWAIRPNGPVARVAKRNFQTMND